MLLWGHRLAVNSDSDVLPQVEPPTRGDALRSLRMTDSTGTSLWWRSYVCAHLPCIAMLQSCSLQWSHHMLVIRQMPLSFQGLSDQAAYH